MFTTQRSIKIAHTHVSNVDVWSRQHIPRRFAADPRHRYVAQILLAEDLNGRSLKTLLLCWQADGKPSEFW